jgi:hypothetical protein
MQYGMVKVVESVIGSVRSTLDSTVDLAKIGKKKPTKIKVVPRRKKPEMGFVKINVDANFVEDNLLVLLSETLEVFCCRRNPNGLNMLQAC